MAGRRDAGVGLVDDHQFGALTANSSRRLCCLMKSVEINQVRVVLVDGWIRTARCVAAG